MVVIPSPSQDPFAAFSNLPGPVRAFLINPSTQTSFRQLLDSTSLKGDLRDKVVDLVGDLDLGWKKLEELVPWLVKELAWPDEQAKKFAADLAGFRYLPIERFLKTKVWPQIESWGGDPKKYPLVKIESQPITIDQLIDELIKETKIELAPNLLERFRHLLRSRLKGVRDDLELAAMLARPEKVGGVGLSVEIAERVMGILRLKLASAEIVETEPPKTKDSKPKITPPPPLPLTPEQIDKKIQASQDGLLRSSGLAFKDEMLMNRLTSIIAARLKDLRDQAETLTLFAAPLAQGGLNLAPDKARQISNLLEAEFLGLQKQLETQKQREALAFRETEESKKTQKETAKKHQETAVLDQRFLSIIQKSKAIKDKGIILPSPSLVSPLPTRPIIPSPKPVLSPASISAPAETKPKIKDIKFERKIIGPTEELQTLTLIEFRRLSRDPAEAAAKIKDKIELLKQEGYETQVRAIRAWQESEPNRLYLSLTQAALETGRPIVELVNERTSQNQPTLTLTEFQALLSLNSSLRL